MYWQWLWISFSLAQALQPDQAILSYTSPEGSSGLVKADENHYGIGFDFSTTFGNAAISYANGSRIGLVKVAANEEFQHLCYMLTLPESRHLAPPYADMGEYYNDLPRQTWRKFRKGIGLPASNEARIIGELVKQLRNSMEEQLGYPITYAVASFPYLDALYLEDVADALEWAGLKHQRISSFHRPTEDVPSIFAAHRISLCEHFKNYTRCDQEQLAIDTRYFYDNDLAIHFALNKDALVISITMLASPYGYYRFMESVRRDFKLGLGSSTSPDYWSKVEESINHLLQKHAYNWRDFRRKRVSVVGEGSSYPEFWEVVRKTTQQTLVHEEDELMFFPHDEFMGAKGSAELSMRAKYGYPFFSDW